MALKVPIASVFHPPYFAFGITELANNEIEPSVLVQIGRGHVRYTRNVFEQYPICEVVRAVVFQHDHRTKLSVTRRNYAHGGDKHVEMSIAIHVRYFDMCGTSD